MLTPGVAAGLGQLVGLGPVDPALVREEQHPVVGRRGEEVLDDVVAAQLRTPHALAAALLRAVEVGLGALGVAARVIVMTTSSSGMRSSIDMSPSKGTILVRQVVAELVDDLGQLPRRRSCAGARGRPGSRCTRRSSAAARRAGRSVSAAGSWIHDAGENFSEAKSVRVHLAPTSGWIRYTVRLDRLDVRVRLCSGPSIPCGPLRSDSIGPASSALRSMRFLAVVRLTLRLRPHRWRRCERASDSRGSTPGTRRGLSAREVLGRGHRRAIEQYAWGENASQSKKAFGLWRKRGLEGLSYERRLREEW